MATRPSQRDTTLSKFVNHSCDEYGLVLGDFTLFSHGKVKGFKLAFDRMLNLMIVALDKSSKTKGDW